MNNRKEGGRKEENKLLLQGAITLLHSQGKEAPQVIPVVPATPNPALPCTRAKAEAGTKLGSLVNEKWDCSGTSSAVFPSWKCLSVPEMERQKWGGQTEQTPSGLV